MFIKIGKNKKENATENRIKIKKVYRKKKSNFEKEKNKENEKSKSIDVLNKSISYLNKILQEGNFVELSYLIGNKKEMFIRNFFAGIGRGIGIGIGVTVITAILIIILQKIVTLNIPIIGEYIADIVEIVQKSR